MSFDRIAFLAAAATLLGGCAGGGVIAGEELAEDED